jgi:hypothetical protein
MHSKQSQFSILLKHRRLFSSQKLLKIFSHTLLLRNRRFFFGNFKRPFRRFVVKKIIQLQKQK